MKGITPIISIIILLLITVGLAYTAWTYLGNYVETLTAKNIEIPTQKCVNGNDVMVIVRNMGTESVSTAGAGNEIIIINGTQALTDAQVYWCSLTGSCAVETTSIPPGGYAKATIDECCNIGSCPKTCSFEFVVAARSQTVTVYCPGTG